MVWKIVGPKKFCVKKNVGPKKTLVWFWSEKVFWSKKIFGPKKNFGLKEIFGPKKNFEPKKYFCPKKHYYGLIFGGWTKDDGGRRLKIEDWSGRFEAVGWRIEDWECRNEAEGLWIEDRQSKLEDFTMLPTHLIQIILVFLYRELRYLRTS